MPRFLQYDEAVGVLSRVESLTAEELRRLLDVSPSAAVNLLQRFADEGLVEPQEEGSARYRVVGRRRRSWGGTRPAAPPREALGGEQAEIARLQRELTAMRHRALQAEARLSAAQAPDVARRDERLRRLLAFSLHPDTRSGDPAARRVMDELFRTLWPQVNAILDGRSEPEDEGPLQS